MKPEEAIKAIESNYPPVNYTMLRESLDLAIQALEKQVAKKPIDIYNRVPLIIIYCPECERNLTDEYGNRYEYCPNCGTPIDWGN